MEARKRKWRSRPVDRESTRVPPDNLVNRRTDPTASHVGSARQLFRGHTPFGPMSLVNRHYQSTHLIDLRCLSRLAIQTGSTPFYEQNNPR